MSEITIVNGATQSITVGGDTVQNVTVQAVPAVEISAGMAFSDVALSGLTDGDVLRYSGTAKKWQNYSESKIVDGGNF